MTDRIRDAYNHIAADYAARYSTMPPVLASLGNNFLGILPPTPFILDAGCGTGRDMAWFESHGATVTGIDLSSGMLAEARTIVRGDLHEMDLTAIDLPDHTFDGVWCNAALLHIPRVSAPNVVARFHRLLKTDGIAMISLQVGDGEAWEEDIYPGTKRYFARYPVADAQSMLEAAGFAIVSTQENPGARHWLHLLARPIDIDT